MKSFIIALTILLLTPTLTFADNEADWKKVREAEGKGLPKTAIEHLNRILKATNEKNQNGEWLKAFTEKLSRQAEIEGNSPEARITELRKEIPLARKENAAILNAILAKLYWSYFEQNRWRFAQRTQTAGMESDGAVSLEDGSPASKAEGADSPASSKDFKSWDLPRLFKEIDSLFSTALAAKASLSKIPISSLRDFLEAGTMPEDLRPTLYDFIAHEALAFYESAEQAGAHPEDYFEIPADSSAFGTIEEFLAYSPDTSDLENPTLKAIALYKTLIADHLRNNNTDAVVDLNISRLLFVKNNAVGDNQNKKLIAQLETLLAKYPNLKISTLVSYRLAQAWGQEGDRLKAHQIALACEKKDPQSLGSQSCASYRNELETKSLSINAERSIPTQLSSGSSTKGSKILLTYNNISQLYFRVVKDDWKAFMSKQWGYPEYISQEEALEIMKRTAAKEWAVELQPTSDFQPKNVELELPKLTPGFYRLFASSDPDFRTSQMVQHSGFWVCDYSIITRPKNGRIEGLVLDANTGEPITGATIKLIYRDNAYFHFGNQTETDKDGIFYFKALGRSNEHYVYLSHRNQELFDSNSLYLGYSDAPSANEQALFFTDRSLYRPSQAIQFKGILVRVDTEKNNYQTLAQRKVTVTLRDTNMQEVARLKLQTNDFGSFTGSFTAPSDRLMGAMSINAEYFSGSTTIRVEEYKRPKFQVTLETPKQSYRLNDQVVVSGKAENYNGAAVDNAKVRYQVRRQVLWPWWCYYCYHYTVNQSQEIAHGEATTDAEGSFAVKFLAKPDLQAAIEADPSFHFTLAVDVTSPDGETRSGESSVIVGYSALAIRIEAPETIFATRSFDVNLNTQTLDGSPIPARDGTIRVFTVKQPETPVPAPLWNNDYTWRIASKSQKSGQTTSPSDWRTWQRDKLYSTNNLDTQTANPQKLNLTLPEGVYQIEVESRDRFGKQVVSTLPIMVLPNWNATKTLLKVPSVVKLQATTVPVGSNLQAVWVTGYNSGRALVEINHKGEAIKRYWTAAGTTAHSLDFPVNENLRGGFGLRITQVRENRVYTNDFAISVPWDNKQLSVTTATFRDKLRPGSAEEWKFKVTGKDQELVAAELAATLYDSSLDAFYPHNWSTFDFFATGYESSYSIFANRSQSLQTLRDDWNHYVSVPQISYTHFPTSLHFLNMYYGRDKRKGLMMERSRAGGAQQGMDEIALMDENKKMDAPTELSAAAPAKSLASSEIPQAEGVRTRHAEPGAATSPEPAKVSMRKNLQETAFFYPQLQLENDGSVSITFTVPEALTKWKFMGFAHGTHGESGLLTNYTTTQKELMVQPNAPRFMREGDEIYFSAKVINMTDAAQTGTVVLDLIDLVSGESITGKFGVRDLHQTLKLEPKESKAFSWALKIPLGTNPIAYTVGAATADYSDGEAGVVPVLSSRIYLTESLPLSIRGPREKSFTFERIGHLQDSPTLDPQKLTIQVASNPAWYAVQALPYLIEFPYECSEQVFNRLYANALAAHIANANPKIRQIFDSWKGTAALQSNLEKNQQLKSALLEETPWVMEAKTETQAKQNVGVLFDDNTLKANTAKTYAKLASMQLSNGAWSWFPGGRPDSFITLYVVSGFGRLRNMGVEPKIEMPLRAIGYLDSWIQQTYNELQNKRQNNLTPSVALYLYARSFFLRDKPLGSPGKVAVDYYLGQSKKYWLELGSRQSQGHLALAALRFGNSELAHEIATSFKERSVSSEEFGMYWQDSSDSWWWYQAPIETQALMIEVFNEITKDSQAVEDSKVWLLKQKQTQDWKTTKATSDAIYALLLTGQDLLASGQLVKAELGGKPVEPKTVEPGTGYYEVSYSGKEIQPSFSKITLSKKDKGIAWGGVHFQYFEDISKVTGHNTNLSLDKQLFVKRNTKKGDVLEPVKGALEVGDLVIARIILKTDRDMEYVHLKDGRGSGLEPVNVISQYKMQDGLYYYESTKDTASHFFIDYLPKGTYVFEYPLRVQLKGHYQSGLAEIQCMYAPEFNSHSQSLWLDVR